MRRKKEKRPRNYTPEQREASRQRLIKINQLIREGKIVRNTKKTVIQHVPKGESNALAEGSEVKLSQLRANSSSEGALRPALPRECQQSNGDSPHSTSRDIRSGSESNSNHGELPKGSGAASDSQMANGEVRSDSSAYSSEHSEQQPDNTSSGVEFTGHRKQQLEDFISDPVKWGEWLFDCKLDEWQREAAYVFATGKRVSRSVCNNGGKSRLFSILGSWALAGHRKVRVVMTAGVYRQCEVMRDELSRVMHKLGDGWRLKEQELVHPRGTKMVWYSADNPGAFEGQHDEYVVMLIDEAKSVDHGIYLASERCTATFKRFCMVASSPGGATGWFYDTFATKKEFWDSKCISAYDIPRIPREEIEETKRMHGEDSALFKSKILGQFQSSDEGALIQLEWINHIIANPPRWVRGYIVVGIDLSASKNGDMSAIVWRNGNKIIRIFTFREEDEMKVVQKCEEEFLRQGYTIKSKFYIFADSGGLGGGIVSRLKEKGWPITGVDFGANAIEKTERVKNRMTELWDSMADELKYQRIGMDHHQDLIEQLVGRKAILTGSGRLKLETKMEMRKRGLKSPDIADALALALQQPVSHVQMASVYHSSENGNYDRGKEGYTTPDGFDLGN